MKAPLTLSYVKYIIACLLSFLIAFLFSFGAYAQVQAEEGSMEVSSYDEFTSSLSQIQSTGGTIVLTQDITIPAEESYTYNNARYRKEVVIETNGHTIYVDGHLELWPFLTIHGEDSQRELFRVCPGGELRLISICLNVGENGVAVVQEEGAFLVYASEKDENMGLPEFTCTGQIISSQTITAAACWRYNCEKLPVIRIPDGADFSADMLPDKVMSIVNRDHQEYEEEVPVVWDKITFPTEHKRTLVTGKFVDGYAQYEDYMPRCLVVWESDTTPFFLNVYLESATQWYDMVFMHGESPQSGTIYIQSSDDGENWTDIAGADGYAPVEVKENDSFSWILSYDRSDSAQERPKYYRLLQISDDGTEFYSEALELNDDLIFTVADIDGGRGGEISPNEGENQLPNGIPETDNEDESVPSKSPDPSSGSESNIVSDESKEPNNETTEPEDHSDNENQKESSDSDTSSTPDGASSPNEIPIDIQPEEEKKNEQKTELVETNGEQLGSVKTDDQILGSTDIEKMVGIVIVICILAGSVAFFVFKKKR